MHWNLANYQNSSQSQIHTSTCHPQNHHLLPLYSMCLSNKPTKLKKTPSFIAKIHQPPSDSSAPIPLDFHPGRWTAGTYSHHPWIERKIIDQPNLHFWTWNPAVEALQGCFCIQETTLIKGMYAVWFCLLNLSNCLDITSFSCLMDITT